jgi:hypothetical protein
MAYDELFFRFHAIERMLEHDILEIEVRDVLEHGDMVEGGVDQFGMPRQLYLGFVARRPIHIATIDDHERRRTEIITLYEPNLDEWNPGYRTRRRR